MVTTTSIENNIFQILTEVTDPEIPVLTIEDLGVLRKVEVKDNKVFVTITPTYTGCPAMDMIRVNILAALENAGYLNVEIETVLSPAWTTDWISKEGREKLEAYGIAPPQPHLKGIKEGVPCPLCKSTHTVVISAFGSTPCKALYRCEECKEPFDYFKCH
jgi:ring-1,2-phenylacetyl-CoA epoxidase subunit PaaD